MDHSNFPETPSPQSERRFPAGTRVRMPKPRCSTIGSPTAHVRQGGTLWLVLHARSGGEARSSATPIGADMALS